jgi:ketosteroid isomerase-like protein
MNPMPTAAAPPSLEPVIDFYQQITPERLGEIEQLYAANAHFKDPFNAVHGTAAIRSIFEHMFRSLHEPRFVVTGQVRQGQQAFLTWDFRFRFQRWDTTTVQTVRGASHLVFNHQGQITLHRDYWDAAEELYEKLPFVGGLMRWLKQRARQ